jgi:hypothetical protein
MQRPVDNDNFQVKKHEAKKAADVLDVYIRLLKEQQLGGIQKMIVRDVALKAKDRALSALDEYGPHIVWFSDHPSYRSGSFHGDLDEIAAAEEKVKKLSIELGELRRRQRSKG